VSAPLPSSASTTEAAPTSGHQTRSEATKVVVLDSPDAQLALLAQLLKDSAVPTDYRQITGPDVDLVGVLRDATVLVTEATAIGAELLDELPKLRLVVRAGIGIDIIDVAGARSRGVRVANVPNFCVDEVADHTVLLVLAAVRRLVPYAEDVRAGGWQVAMRPGIRRMSKLTVGVVGLGAIGSRVMQRLQGFGCTILVHDPRTVALPDGVRSVALDRLFAESDIITLHCPLTEHTRGLLSGQALSANLKQPYVINVSRGELVDIDALDALIEAGHVSGAAVDVLPGEPWPDLSHAFVSRPEVLVTPHVAWQSDDALHELNVCVHDTIQDFVQHGRVMNEVEVA
jgi:D-3-phosphoglycerate dehydrogenase / 2-oxoglutarate reductase